MDTTAATCLFARAQRCLELADPEAKLTATARAAEEFAAGLLVVDAAAPPPQPIGAPGRPERPRLVSPRQLPRRGLGTHEGRLALLHAVAHIEFNAINLAWDAVYRFRGMPGEYYRDWIVVATDEARHFSLLQARLSELGGAYGDFDAHDGLWEMAVKTADSCLARMALVPRVLEARGLDVTPAMIARLRGVGDAASAAILDIILREEVAHVAAGSRWFAYCCAREGRDPDATFAALIAEHARGALKGPFNVDARLAAGFSAAELARLEAAA
ncbi:MAG: ferritin-like domain-containing protein [Rudaea sp.]